MFERFVARLFPSPDCPTLTIATRKVVEGLLQGPHRRRLPEGPAILTHPLYCPIPQKLIDEYLGIRPSTLHHWILSTPVELTPQEKAMKQHIVDAVSEGYKAFQGKISSVSTLAGRPDFVELNQSLEFVLPLKTLHDPEVFKGLLRGAGIDFHDAVEQSAISIGKRRSRASSSLAQR